MSTTGTVNNISFFFIANRTAFNKKRQFISIFRFLEYVSYIIGVRCFLSATKEGQAENLYNRVGNICNVKFLLFFDSIKQQLI
jgi:hypothetical protein